MTTPAVACTVPGCGKPGHVQIVARPDRRTMLRPPVPPRGAAA